jgi:hypothetical protein
MRGVMRKTGVALFVGLAACNARQLPTAFEHCGLEAHLGWSQIEFPPERAEIIQIQLSEGRYRSVGEQLLTASIERETWFKNTDGRVAACVYTPTAMDACEGGVPRTILFRSNQGGWEITERKEGFCLE